MNPVWQRLKEIARELGEDDPQNRFFEKLLSISSGRVTQISRGDSVGKVGPKGLANLALRGYNPKWVNYGPPNKKLLADQDHEKITQLKKAEDRDIAEVVALMEATDDKGRALVLGAAREALRHHTPIRKHRAS